MTDGARVRTIKTLAWALTGLLCVVTVARFLSGLGATTALSDTQPWGLWIAFDVMAGVALSAGGFVLSALVYVFKLETYRPFVRPAILTALLGYISVTVGLLYDVGLPWHIWHPIIYPQLRSVLFEVAMCVMLYLTVLFLEFGPVILEHPRFAKPVFRSLHRILKKLAVALVITGAVLSTLHQSSLGSLFLITPHRLDPLWYSPYLWIFFFISAVGLGLLVVTLEALYSGWLFHHRVDIAPLAKLAKAASALLFAYAGLRIGDLAIRDELWRAFGGTPLSFVFWLEILTSALLPAVLLAIPRVRNRRSGLLVAAAIGVFGIVGYRFNVCIVACFRPSDVSYFPTGSELAVSAGIVAVAMLVFIFASQHLKVFAAEHAPPPAGLPPEIAFHPSRMRLLLPPALAHRRLYFFAALGGAAVGLGMLPAGALYGSTAIATAVMAPMEVRARVHAPEGGKARAFTIAQGTSPARDGHGEEPVMLIDGNRNGRLVVFPHEKHQEVLGAKTSCPTCHHANVPFQLNTSCARCHRDMYLPTDTFDHTSHVAKLAGNRSCPRCHTDPEVVKDRKTAAKCETCHADMLARASRVERPKAGMTGMAPGYMDAMHRLCVKCHRQQTQEQPLRFREWFKECAACHRDTSGRDLRERAPYADHAPTRG
jgi:Ni/Fe-hydrogenase subunit HybB-like protein